MKIDEILYEMEGKCIMDIAAPAKEEEFLRLEEKYPQQAKHLKELYLVTNGVEINVPGTILHSASQTLALNKGRDPEGILEIGVKNFGDRLYIAANGRILQIDHETGEVFLEWESLVHFLADELSEI